MYRIFGRSPTGCQNEGLWRDAVYRAATYSGAIGIMFVPGARDPANF